MYRVSIISLILLLSISFSGLAQGRRISSYPYTQNFDFVTSLTTAFPTADVDGGEFTLDALTSGWITAIGSHGLNNNGGTGGAIRLQTTASAGNGQAGFVVHNDFTDRMADSLIISWRKVANGSAGSPPRINELRIATNGGSGTTFTNIPGITWPTFSNTATVESGVLSVKLPSNLSNAADVRIRIYSVNVGGAGNQPRVVVDDLVIKAPRICGGQPSPITDVEDRSRSQTSITLGYSADDRTDSVLIIGRRDMPPLSTPMQGIRYGAGQGLSGTDTVLYFGPRAGTATLTGLQVDALYHFALYGFQSCNSTYSSTPGRDSVRTYCIGSAGRVVDVTTRYSTATTVGLSTTVQSGVSDIILFSSGPDDIRPAPVDGTPHTIGDIVGDDTVRYVGVARNPIVSGLSPATTYRFHALGLRSCNYAYDVTGDTVRATTAAPCGPNAMTTAPDSLVVRKNVRDTLTISWKRIVGANRYLVIARVDSTPVASLLDGGFYTSGDRIGNAFVMARTTDTVAQITNLPANTAYFIRIYGIRDCDLTYGPASRLFTFATAGPADTRRIPLRAGILDTVEFGGARLGFVTAPQADGSLLIVRHTGHPGAVGLPMSRNLGRTINIVSGNRWWSITKNGLGSFRYDLRLDLTGHPGVQDTSDLDIVYRAGAEHFWADRVRTGQSLQNGLYLKADDLFIFGDFAIGAHSSVNLLPVHLLHFEGIGFSDRNILRWSTASEIDNAGFRISRAPGTIGSDTLFMPIGDYRTHAELVSSGSGRQSRSYRFIDAGIEPGRSYIYRLEEIEIDGTSRALGSITVAGDSRSDAHLGEVFITPNPVVDGATIIRARGNPGAAIDITLYDAIGTCVRSYAGDIPFNGWFEQTIEIDDLPVGLYLCHVVTEESTSMRTIMVYPSR